MFIDLSYEVFRWVRALGLVENYVCVCTSVQRFVLVKVFLFIFSPALQRRASYDPSFVNKMKNSVSGSK